MSAAARGAAGYLYAKGRIGGRKNREPVLRATADDVRSLEATLATKFNLSPARAKELAAEQAAKGFSTAAKAARR